MQRIFAGSTALFPGIDRFGERDSIIEIKEIYGASQMLRRAGYSYPGIWIFGDWVSALRAAGFDPEEKRIEKVWSADKVVREV